MFKTATTVIAAFLAAYATLASPPAKASDDPQLDAAVRQLQSKWEQIKFTVPEGPKQTELMGQLGGEADAVAAQYPNRAEALIWDGIITSERASMVNPISALLLAKRARNTLEKAYQIDPRVLDAGAPTSLGVLYYRVPSFPMGFGDTAKARALLEQAVRDAPAGLDAWYFYGDFLFSQKDYAKAADVFQHALTLPPHPDRPLWDHNRRLVIQDRLNDIKSKS